jgi:prolyl oligopeptidase PreP (S9A serine peptidase family)
VCGRGGGEYGIRWREAGSLHNKQNVFDDFIATAEYLIDAGYTTPAKLVTQVDCFLKVSGHIESKTCRGIF